MLRIGVLGAGSVGAYVGGLLQAAGASVTLVGRATIRARIAKYGLVLTDLHGERKELAADRVRFVEDASALADVDLILVTVKSAATAEAARVLRAHARPDALVISFQNGIGNADILRQQHGQQIVLAGMVPFNVVQLPDGRFHRGSEGSLVVQASPALDHWRTIFASAGLPLQERTDFEAVQWGKLLLNLNNPLNALSGLPLKTELSQRAWRRCLAILIAEALRVLDRAGIGAARVAKVGPRLLPPLLRLPDALFARIAGSMLRIDAEARSSMWEDLQAGRATEIDSLNGAVVRLAGSVGMDAPANRRVVGLVREAEAGRLKSMDGATLLRQLNA